MSRIINQFILFLAILGNTRRTQPCDATQDTRISAVKERILSQTEHVNRFLQDNSRELLFETTGQTCEAILEDAEDFPGFSCTCSQSGADFSIGCETELLDCFNNGNYHQMTQSSLVRNGLPVTSTWCAIYTGEVFNHRLCGTDNYCADGYSGCSCSVIVDNRACNSCSFCATGSSCDYCGFDRDEWVSLDCSNLAAGASSNCAITNGGGALMIGLELLTTILEAGGGTGDGGGGTAGGGPSCSTDNCGGDGSSTLPCGTRIVNLYRDNPALGDAASSLGGDIDFSVCSTDTATLTTRCMFNPNTISASGPLPDQVEAFRQACSDAGGDEARQAFNITCDFFDESYLDLDARFIMPVCSFRGCADQTPSLVSYAASYEQSAEDVEGIDCVMSAAFTIVKDDVIGTQDGTSRATVLGWTIVAVMFMEWMALG
jgi:hypothetical protein